MDEGLLFGMGVRQASKVRLTASSARHKTMVGEPIAGEVCAQMADDHKKNGSTPRNADRELLWATQNRS